MDDEGRRSGGSRGDERYTLAALTEAAGVSVRTVRYYISEGLLPPPVGAGRASHYTTGHLNRLALIARLKDAYLPLKEIRRRLAGLSDAEVTALLAEEAAAEAAVVRAAEADHDDALTYIDRVLTPAAGGAVRRAAEAAARAPVHMLREASPPWEGELARGAAEAAAEEPIDHGEPWLRIRLGDEAELLVSDRLLRRRREKVDWLVRWARQVFR